MADLVYFPLGFWPVEDTRYEGSDRCIKSYWPKFPFG